MCSSDAQQPHRTELTAPSAARTDHRSLSGSYRPDRAVRQTPDTPQSCGWLMQKGTSRHHSEWSVRPSAQLVGTLPGPRGFRLRRFSVRLQGHAFGAPPGTAAATLRAQTARHQAADPAQHPRSAARACGDRRRWRQQHRRFLRAAALRRGGCLARFPRARPLPVQAVAPGDRTRKN
jgi:hypothetical protein